MSGRVIVVGSSNTDLVTRCARLPRAGETVLGGDLQTFAGGKGANQAVAAARAGARVRFVGAFGDDAFGAARRADLERERIDCSFCTVKKGSVSGVALIAIGQGRGGARAENQIIVAPGANARLTPADVKRAMPGDLDAADVLVVSLEVPLESVFEAMRIVRAHGGTVILNPAPFPPDGLPARLLACADLLTPNETEFEQLCGVPVGDRRAPARLAKASGCGRAFSVLVTRGPKGVDLYAAGPWTRRPDTASSVSGSVGQPRSRSCAKGRGRAKIASSPIRHVPGFARAPKVEAVDTVGAGDCFNGALAAQLAARPGDLASAAAYAAAAAALKVTRQGAQAGMPRRAEVLRWLER